MQAYDAAHFVVGHTPQRDGRIRSRFAGKVFLIDTGMLHSYYPFGRASALEIENQSKFTAQYIDGQNILDGAPENGRSNTCADQTAAPCASLRKRNLSAAAVPESA